MANLIADGVEINIEDGKWRLYNLQGSNSLSPFFYAVRGTRLLNYVSRFGEARGLPGTVLSADYVRAVIVGFDDKRRRWLLGLQVAESDNDKPRFAELVRWPEGENEQYAADSHTSGRILAEYIGCPLKLFGVKKTIIAGGASRGPTGPLEPHRRTDIDLDRVRNRANMFKLPMQTNGVWLGAVRNSFVLRLSKEADQPKGTGEAPAFNQCVIDKDARTVRLVPPTGLLGVFLGPQGRAIKFQDIRNVERRRTIIHESLLKTDTDGTAVDVTTTREVFAIYLTLAEESVLLTQFRHAETSELARHRAKSKTMLDGDYDSEREMSYLRQHEADQAHRDQIATFIEGASVVIATAIGCQLVETEIGDEPV